MRAARRSTPAPFEDMLYVYAISESPQVPEVSGLDGAPLRRVGSSAPFAIVSEHEDLPLERGEKDLWTHERVVEEAMATGAVLPMRFGSSLPDQAAVTSALRERKLEFERGLDRVRGAVELSVRATLNVEEISKRAEPHRTHAGGAPAEGPGTAYMRARLSRTRGAGQLADRIHVRLAPLARASTLRVGTGGRPSMKAAYLVSRERTEAFRERLERIEREVEEMSLACTGPWPPYSFVSEEGDE
jgi:Gas vesicle synthesis protein GvpL/GvpF